MIFLITYDKNVLLKNYGPLYEAIKGCSESWWHHMNNTWLIRTKLSATQIFNILSPHITQQDKLLIIQIQKGSQYQGWLKQDAWDWIKKNSHYF